MPEKHVLITGPIQGRIQHGKDWVDVTPDTLEFDSPEEAQAVADSIELEHAARGTHPIQQECQTLGPLNDAVQSGKDHGQIAAHILGVHDHEAVLKAHQSAHKALNKKAGL